MATPTINTNNYSLDPVVNPNLDTTSWAAIIAPEILSTFQQAGALYTLDEVTSAFIADGSITTSKLASNSVTSDKIVNGSIQQADLSLLSVGTGQLIDNAVSTAKITNGAINNSKIQDSAVTGSKILNNTITGSAKIINNTVPVAKLQPSSPNVVFGSDSAGQPVEILTDDLGGGGKVLGDVDLSDTDTIDISISEDHFRYIIVCNKLRFTANRGLTVDLSDDGGTSFVNPGEDNIVGTIPNTTHEAFSVSILDRVGKFTFSRSTWILATRTDTTGQFNPTFQEHVTLFHTPNPINFMRFRPFPFGGGNFLASTDGHIRVYGMGQTP